MTIDDRVEKLAERADAIAQSVELLTSLYQDNERRLAEYAAKTEARFAQNEKRMAELMETVNRLANVVSRREEPLDDLDDRRN